MSGKSAYLLKPSGVGLKDQRHTRETQKNRAPTYQANPVANEKRREERNEDRQRVQCYCRDSEREMRQG